MTYINGIGAITPQNTFSEQYPFFMVPVDGDRFVAREPDYRNCIEPRRLRRMSRLIKMGVACSMNALQEAGVQTPDAVVTGTGFGCLQQTESFLTALIENDERFLNPAPFIHSTHNTISSQIALILNCTGYNSTYSHRFFSFESALLDSQLHLEEGNEIQTILVGGIDELTPTLFDITDRFGIIRKKSVPAADFFNPSNSGIVPGEGAVFFLVSGERSKSTYARISGISTIYDPGKTADTVDRILRFLEDCRLQSSDLDLCLLGKNGDERADSVYSSIETTVLKGLSLAYYKNLCGESFISTSFAVWLAANVIRHQVIPNMIDIQPQIAGTVRNILICNRSPLGHLSLILVSGEKRE